MILEFDGIQFGYNEHQLLSGIYVKCEIGKITGLLGRNGSGKKYFAEVGLWIYANRSDLGTNR